MRVEYREQAEREAQLIRREALAKADDILSGVKSEVRRVQGDLEQIVRQRRAYLSQLRSIIERQLSEVEAAEASPSSQNPSPPPSAISPDENGGERKDTPAWLNSLTKDEV